jgi:Transcriptional regulatory protein, C terminal
LRCCLPDPPGGRHDRRRHRSAVVDRSPREFALLELFLAHPGVVLTRTRILEHVWDFAYDPASNVVDQYVGYLRRKVDRPFGRQDLETVHWLAGADLDSTRRGERGLEGSITRGTGTDGATSGGAAGHCSLRAHPFRVRRRG